MSKKRKKRNKKRSKPNIPPLTLLRPRLDDLLQAAAFDKKDAKLIKSLSYGLENELGPIVILLGAEIEGKPFLSLQISQSIIDNKQMNAGSIIRELAKNIQGGGGGQPFFATAGGKNSQGLDAALEQIDTFLD